jgi:hypothetical protein
MMRARNVFAATLAAIMGASLIGVSVFAQQAPAAPAAPPMKSILAGKKFTPPIRGEASVDYVKSPTRREGSTLVTKIQVKNTSKAPIPRLKIAETWYDKAGELIPGGDAVVNGLLQPDEVATLEIRTPVNLKMATSMLQFSHANGTVPKPHAVKSFDAPGKEAAAKPAAAAKAAPKAAAKKK